MAPWFWSTTYDIIDHHHIYIYIWSLEPIYTISIELFTWTWGTRLLFQNGKIKSHNLILTLYCSFKQKRPCVLVKARGTTITGAHTTSPIAETIGLMLIRYRSDTKDIYSMSIRGFCFLEYITWILAASGVVVIFIGSLKLFYTISIVKILMKLGRSTVSHISKRLMKAHKVKHTAYSLFQQITLRVFVIARGQTITTECITSQIAKTLGSMSIRYRSDTKVSDRNITDVDPRVLVTRNVAATVVATATDGDNYKNAGNVEDEDCNGDNFGNNDVYSHYYH